MLEDVLLILMLQSAFVSEMKAFTAISFRYLLNLKRFFSMSVIYYVEKKSNRLPCMYIHKVM